MANAETREKTDWLAVLALFAAGLVAAMQFAKVSPIMDVIGVDLHLSLVAAGFAVSILGMIGIVFAISMGNIVGSLGLRRGILVALIGGSLIAVLGSAAPNGVTFLISRLCEGFSHLLIVICAPALMAAHANSRDRPIALALWGCFFGLGFAITSAVAPHIVPLWGWRGLLLSHASLMMLVALLIIFTVRPLDVDKGHGNLPRLQTLIQAHVNVYRSGPPLLLALTFCCYTILFLAVLTFLGRYLIEARHWSISQTGAFQALVALISLGFTLSAGFLIRLGVSLFVGVTTAFTLLALSGVALFTDVMPELSLIPTMLLMMASFGLLPGFVFASVPTMAPTPFLTSLTYGAIAQFGNVGTFLGTPIFAAAYKSFGWNGGAVFVGMVGLIGIVLTAKLRHSIHRAQTYIETGAA
ncbi:MAG: MFS transporter [Pseudomonadota bacterium]|nr:MFS transporter [Pseudomonadota bacterium]